MEIVRVRVGPRSKIEWKDVSVVEDPVEGNCSWRSKIQKMYRQKDVSVKQAVQGNCSRRIEIEWKDVLLVEDPVEGNCSWGSKIQKMYRWKDVSVKHPVRGNCSRRSKIEMEWKDVLLVEDPGQEKCSPIGRILKRVRDLCRSKASKIECRPGAQSAFQLTLADRTLLDELRSSNIVEEARKLREGQLANLNWYEEVNKPSEFFFLREMSPSKGCKADEMINLISNL